MNGLWLGLCVGLLMGFSKDCMAAAVSAAVVFATGVMPALFPMMVLAGLPLVQRSSSGEGSLILSVIAFGFFSGSPAGARRVESLLHAGRLNGLLARRLFVAIGVMSPLFFLGTLSLWTKNPFAALLMLASHWSSALLVGGLACLPFADGLLRGPTTPSSLVYPAPVIPTQPPPPFLTALPDAITGAARSLLGVCGAMMLFSVVAAILRGLLFWLFPGWAAEQGGVLALVHAMLEIGSGASAVIQSHILLTDRTFALLCGLCSFGGFSLWIQNLTFAGQSVRPLALLCARAVHGAVAYGVCRLLFLLWPQAEKTFAVTAPALPSAAADPLPALLSLLILALLAAFWQKSKTCSPHN